MQKSSEKIPSCVVSNSLNNSISDNLNNIILSMLIFSTIKSLFY